MYFSDMENLFCQQAPASAGAGSGGNAAVNGTPGKDVKDSGEKDKKKDDVSSSFIVIYPERSLGKNWAFFKLFNFEVLTHFITRARALFMLTY